MSIELHFDEAAFEALMGDLLPPRQHQEEAAFVCARGDTTNGSLNLTAVETLLMDRRDFESQHADYLELGDEARARVIKAAHMRQASLVEFHSHLGAWPAEFSLADRIGLRETVPHMWWRLAKRPYVAVVVTRSGFDALAWQANPTNPVAVSAIHAGKRALTPTNRSIRWWNT